MPADPCGSAGRRADPVGRRHPEAQQGCGPIRRRPTHPNPAEVRIGDQAEVLVADQDEKTDGRCAGRCQEKDAGQTSRRRCTRDQE